MNILSESFFGIIILEYITYVYHINVYDQLVVYYIICMHCLTSIWSGIILFLLAFGYFRLVIVTIRKIIVKHNFNFSRFKEIFIRAHIKYTSIYENY